MTVGLCADGIDDGMVILDEVGMGNILAKLDMPVKAKIRIGGDTVINLGNALDLLMIGRDPTAYQPIRSWQAIKHINLNRQVILRLQVTRSIKSGWAGTDNSYPQWVSWCSKWFSHKRL